MNLPPPPHDPNERCCLWEDETWQIRQFALDDPRHGWFASHGMLHLQLWSPSAGVSILTASRLTADQAELWCDGRRARASCYHQFGRVLADAFVTLPCAMRVARYEQLFVHAVLIGLVAKPARGPRSEAW